MPDVKNFDFAVGFADAIIDEKWAMQQLADQTQPSVDTYRQLATLDPTKAAHASARIIAVYMGGKEYPKAQEEADAAITAPVPLFQAVDGQLPAGVALPIAKIRLKVGDALDETKA